MKLHLSRLLIAIVIAWNLQCALAFTVWPATTAPGFELSGEVGAAAIRGMGIFILMWNVPYVVALLHPSRHRQALYESAVMQIIGLLGESWIYTTLLAGSHLQARASIARFIIFDAAGLALLMISIWFSWKS